MAPSWGSDVSFRRQKSTFVPFEVRTLHSSVGGDIRIWIYIFEFLYMKFGLVSCFVCGVYVSVCLALASLCISSCSANFAFY